MDPTGRLGSTAIAKHICRCIYTSYTYICIHTYIYTYVYTHTSTYTYIYMYMYTCTHKYKSGCSSVHLANVVLHGIPSLPSWQHHLLVIAQMGVTASILSPQP